MPLHYPPADVPDLVEIRFVDAEAEAKAATWIAEERARREAFHLDKALGDWTWKHCKHPVSDCSTCAAAWVASPEHAVDVATAKAKAAAYHPLAFTLGSRWRVPVGAAFVARVEPLLMLLVWPECLSDGFVSEAPTLDLFCNGGRRDDAEELLLLSPLRPDGRYSGAANIAMPVDYVLTHGLRVS